MRDNFLVDVNILRPLSPVSLGNHNFACFFSWRYKILYVQHGKVCSRLGTFVLPYSHTPLVQD